MVTHGTPLGTVTVLVPAVVDENSVVGPAEAVPVVRAVKAVGDTTVSPPTMVSPTACDRRLLVYLTPPIDRPSFSSEGADRAQDHSYAATITLTTFWLV
jgi:hypothetical protein